MSSAPKAPADRAAIAYRVVLAAGLLLCLAANLPGHLSVDSVVALQEGRSGVRQTWAPAISSWLLGRFDDLLSGTGLYVTASAALLYLSWASLPALRPRTSWMAPVLAVPVLLLPQVLIYQGIVWRDVLFANLTVAGFILIAHAVRRWEGGKLAPLLGAWVCFALAALVRQNGLIVVLVAAVALGWAAAGSRRTRLAWGAGFLLATAILAVGLDRIAQPAHVAAKLRPDAASLILQHYDIVGARAHDPSVAFDEIGRADPQARRILEARARQVYSPVRIDTLDQDELVRRTLWHVPDRAMSAQWRQVILQHPTAYLAHRADAFRWVLATPDLAQCLPVQVGVAGPPAMLDELDLTPRRHTQDAALAAYAAKFYGGPAYSHLAYAAAALAVMGVLLLRRDPTDWVIIGLLTGALGFVASFFAISVACDYRYLYLVDLAALTGLLYLAVDPLTWRRRQRAR